MKVNYELINFSLSLVKKMSKLYNIDESHSLRHSLDVFHNTKEIYESEIYLNPFLRHQQREIYCSAIIHDMCDEKYIDKTTSINYLKNNMKFFVDDEEWKNIESIITTMSYSYIKKNGYPDLKNYNLAYNIVREADLLASYDVERCFVYNMYNVGEGEDYITSIDSVENIFNNRMFKYIEDGLFITEYSKKKAEKLHKNAKERIMKIKTDRYIN